MKKGNMDRREFLKCVGVVGSLAAGGGGALNLLAEPALAAEEKKVLRWWVAPPGGPWYAMATAISAVVQEKTGYTLEVGSGGGVVNMFAVNDGKADFGFTATEVLPAAWAGEDPHGIFPFKKPLRNIRQVFLMTENFLHVAVWADTGMRTIDDLRGKRVDAKPVGFSVEAFFKLVLKANGMTYDDIKVSHLGMTDGVLAMKDGHLDAYVLYGPYPQGPFLDLASFKPIHLLEIRKEVIEKLHTMNEAAIPGVIKAGAYRGMDRDVQSVKTELVAFCNKDLPEKQIYAITKAYVENLDKLVKTFAAFKTRTPKDVSISRGIPLHPGAERYFKEVGAL